MDDFIRLGAGQRTQTIGDCQREPSAIPLSDPIDTRRLSLIPDRHRPGETHAKPIRRAVKGSGAEPTEP
jgi:hypothetical protein